jgi:hypothetical protein
LIVDASANFKESSQFLSLKSIEANVNEHQAKLSTNHEMLSKLHEKYTEEFCRLDIIDWEKVAGY